MNAYAFLTKTPHPILIKFCEELCKKHKYHVYIFIDNDDFVLTNTSENIRFIKVNAHDCVHNCMCYATETDKTKFKNQIGKIASIWDKALYYFAYNPMSYSHIWFIEDEVFVSSVDAFKYIDEAYQDSDLLSATNIECELHNVDSWHWQSAIQTLGLPAYRSSMHVCRISKELLQHIKDYAQNLGCIPYIEYAFNTIAMRYALTVNCPKEFSTTDYTFDDFVKTKHHFFYPCVNLEIHDYLRFICKE